MKQSSLLWNYGVVSSATLIAIFGMGVSAIATEVDSPQTAESLAVTANPDPETLAQITPLGENSEELLRSIPTQVLDHSGDSSDELWEQINRYSDETNSLDQVTNVSQLRDVSPGDWAYEALRSLVERYGCIAGYPDSTYRGNRAMTRYEFAAGLNACLQQIERLVAGNQGVDGGDLETLQRLVQEFEAELTTLGARVDNLEARVGFLEDNQFSTTTKLSGEVIFGLAGVAAGDDANGNEIDNVTIFGHRTRIELNTSFTGDDILRTRLQAEGLGSLTDQTLTPEGDLFFTGATDSDVVIDALLYDFPIGDNTRVVIDANAGASDDFADTVNPFLDGDGGSGALSRFGTRHSIYYYLDGAGIGINHAFGDKLEVSAGYLASEAADPGEDNGIFNGPYGALAQILFKPSDRLNIGLTYIHSYNRDTETGSRRSNFRSFTEDLIGAAVPTSSNSYGVELSWLLSDRFALGGWVGYTKTTTLSTLDGQIDRGNLDIWNWAVSLAFPDLGKEGSVAGLLVGMEPKVTDSSVNIPGINTEDDNTSLHIEAFYQYQLTDNIAITPALIWLTAPDHNNDNEDIIIGSIRTTFSF